MGWLFKRNRPRQGTSSKPVVVDKPCEATDRRLREVGYTVTCDMVRRQPDVQWARRIDEQGREWTEHYTGQNPDISVHVVMMRDKRQLSLVQGNPYGETYQQRVRCGLCSAFGIVFGKLPMNRFCPGVLPCPQCGSLGSVDYQDWEVSLTWYNTWTGKPVGTEKW